MIILDIYFDRSRVVRRDIFININISDITAAAAGKMGLPAELYKAIMEDSETAPFVWKMVAHWWEISLTHKANSEEQPQTQKFAANRPAEVPSWANPHEHDTRRDAPGRS